MTQGYIAEQGIVLDPFTTDSGIKISVTKLTVIANRLANDEDYEKVMHEELFQCFDISRDEAEDVLNNIETQTGLAI